MIGHLLGSAARTFARSETTRSRPRLEVLEDRMCPSTLTWDAQGKVATYMAALGEVNQLTVNRGINAQGRTYVSFSDTILVTINCANPPFTGGNAPGAMAFLFEDDVRIVVNLWDGNDRLDVPGLSIPTTAWGGLGDDILNGCLTAYNFLSGDWGNDQLVGGELGDQLFGGADDDELRGGDFADYLDGGNGNDALWGGTGSDNLAGRDGLDFLMGETGNDILDGGNDLFVDQLWGGADADTFYTNAAQDNANDFNIWEGDWWGS